MTYIRAATFNVLFLTLTVVLAVGGLLTLLGPRTWVCRLRDAWISWVLAILRLVVGLDHRVEGSENVPPGPIIVAAKHQSAWETLALNLVFADPIFVLKRELFRLPLIGLYMMKVGMIAVDRSAGAGALKKMVSDADQMVASGRPILVFPEGTRVAPGETRPYHPGVFAIYKKLGIPVVPVVVNSGRFWGRVSFLKRPGTITMRILPAIEPGLDRRSFMAKLEADIEDASRDLDASTELPTK